VEQDTVVVNFNGQKSEVPDNTTVERFMADRLGSVPKGVIAALVNRRLVMLDFPLRGIYVELEAVRSDSRLGEAVARRSSSLVLLTAARELYPLARLFVGQSLGGGYFFSWQGPPALSADVIAALGKRMQEISAEDRPIVRRSVTLEEAEEMFRERNEESKLALLASYRASTVAVVICGPFVDIAQGAVANSTGKVPPSAVVPYEDGLLLRFSRNGNVPRYSPLHPQPKLFAAYRETRTWNEELGIAHVGSLNKHCLTGEIAEVIRIAEGFHEKKIAAIADAVAEQRNRVRVVLVAGPSSSGKTTFIRRLAIQLRVNGIRPLGLSLDDYFLDREKTPLGPDGKPDFEAIEALDLALFNEQLAALLGGRTVAIPRFDFVHGVRVGEGRWAQAALGKKEVLLVEGIHGLNPRLTQAVPEEAKYRVFISALTQLTLDDHNRIFTSDTRLLRRIVRDRLYRGHPAARTLEMWDAVRRGEARGIFPFQEDADVIFNSALVYEPAVLRIYAERLLLAVPREHAQYSEAYRLLKFLTWFVPIPEDDVPRTSILREFIGRSAFSQGKD
jgi:uridine kinase